MNKANNLKTRYLIYLTCTLCLLLCGCGDTKETEEAEEEEEVVVQETQSTLSYDPKDLVMGGVSTDNIYYQHLMHTDQYVAAIKLTDRVPISVNGKQISVNRITNYTESVTRLLRVVKDQTIHYESDTVSQGDLPEPYTEVYDTVYILGDPTDTITLYYKERGKWMSYTSYDGVVTDHGTLLSNMWYIGTDVCLTNVEGILQAYSSDGTELYTFYFDTETKNLIAVHAEPTETGTQIQDFAILAEPVITEIPTDILTSAIELDENYNFTFEFDKSGDAYLSGNGIPHYENYSGGDYD